jgi:hypothetical protein
LRAPPLRRTKAPAGRQDVLVAGAGQDLAATRVGRLEGLLIAFGLTMLALQLVAGLLRSAGDSETGEAGEAP